jgi:hypothetical protein
MLAPAVSRMRFQVSVTEWARLAALRHGTGGVYTDLINSGGAGTSAKAISASSSFNGAPLCGTSTALGIVQPTIVCNYIIRIL